MSIEDYKWMYCTQCRLTVVMNDIGLCLACQRAYSPDEQPDSFRNIRFKEREEERKLTAKGKDDG